MLVTGANGFIGRAVCRLLHDEGHAIVALDQTASSSTGESLGGHCEAWVDISDRRSLRTIFDSSGIGSIIHLAAILPTAAKHDPLRATQVNILGSLNLLDMAREFGVKRFVFGSSLSVYGTCPADKVVSESSPAAPEDLYGASKLYVEQLGAAYRERFGLEFVSLRIGRVVGAGARSATSAWRNEIFEFLHTREKAVISVPYIGEERVLLVHLDDAARALVALLRPDIPAHGIYNAPCESVVVQDLKARIERSNSNLDVQLGTDFARGNPRRVDWSRVQREFGLKVTPILERLASEAEGGAHRS